MKREGRISERDLEALIERGRAIRPLPDVVRARALARASATLAASPASTPADASMPAARGGGLRFALAASIALLAGAAGAVAALSGRMPDQLEMAPPPSPHPILRSRAPTPELAAPPSPVPPAPRSAPQRRTHAATAQESYRAELDLLQGARVAYAGRDFSGALVLVAEHGRRFPNGRLVEEREALRIRSLAGSGRGEEARRAAASFANRFPRSVLLPRLWQVVGTPE